MGDRGALALLRGAARASRRFVVEVAVSFVATLCVTLVLSGWFRPGAASGGSDLVPASSGAPVAAFSSNGGNSPVSSAATSADAKATAAEAPANVPLLVERDIAEKEKPASIHALEPVPVISASSPRPRSPSHVAKAAPRNGPAPCAPACAGHASSEASARTANLEPPLRADPQTPVPTPASIAEEDHRPTVFGLALPPVPVHAVLTHPLRPVLQGASSVTELITGLAGKP